MSSIENKSHNILNKIPLILLQILEIIIDTGLRTFEANLSRNKNPVVRSDLGTDK